MLTLDATLNGMLLDLPRDDYKTTDSKEGDVAEI